MGGGCPLGCLGLRRGVCRDRVRGGSIDRGQPLRAGRGAPRGDSTDEEGEREAAGGVVCHGGSILVRELVGAQTAHLHLGIGPTRGYRLRIRGVL